MSYRRIVLFATVLTALAGSVIADDANALYEKATQAMASKDYNTAVPLLQQAVQADPDSLRNGSDLRQAVLRQTIAAHPKEGAVPDFDKEIAFFEQVTKAHPTSATAFLNYG